MQLALNIAIFFLGFYAAGIITSNPNEIRNSLNHFLSNLRHLLSVFRSTKATRDGFQAWRRPVELDEKQMLTRAEVERLPEESWERQAYEEIKAILLATNLNSKKFPCPYATAGYKSNEHRYVFMHSEDPSEPRNIRLLANVLKAYFPISRSLGSNTSLVIVHPRTNQACTVEDYQQKFWDMLRGLRTCDSQKWPDDIPQETGHARWAFCFDGVPWFPAVLTPAHVKRHSRFAPNFAIAMQPKWVFDELFRTPEKRKAAVQSVRKLLEPFDDVDPSPDLSIYGTEGTAESIQYYLMDDNITAKCPFQDLDR